MSAGVCGKRLGFEEILGSSSSPTSSSSAKRFRCSNFGSPVRSSSEFGFGSEDKVLFLIRMFPNMDPELISLTNFEGCYKVVDSEFQSQLVESILNTHNHKVEDAIDSLQALSLGNEPRSHDIMVTTSNSNISGAETSQSAEHKVEQIPENVVVPQSGHTVDGSSWVDIFVQEMLNASDMDDARARAERILEVFERSVVENSKVPDERMVMEQQELASLKENLHSLLRDNQILKRAVSIQHERTIEHEGKVKEVEQLKLVINQYQEQLRNLEINNYTLKLHLQRAQESSSISGNFHPDIF